MRASISAVSNPVSSISRPASARSGASSSSSPARVARSQPAFSASLLSANTKARRSRVAQPSKNDDGNDPQSKKLGSGQSTVTS